MQVNSRNAGDLVVRYGGEEFVVLMSNATPKAASLAAERFRYSVEALQIPHHGNPDLGIVTASVGTAVLRPTALLTPADLLAYADLALYEAKRQGRNKIWVASVNKMP